MQHVTNILIVGVGGQGIILASDILCLAAMYAGFDVKKNEIHGMSQRGGSVSSHVRYGDKVYSPVVSIKEANIILSFEKMETLRWLKYGNKNTKFVVLENEIKPESLAEYPEDINDELKKCCQNLYIVDPGIFMMEGTSIKFHNTGMLGAISAFTGIPIDIWEKSFREKIREDLFSFNWSMFIKGRDHIKFKLEN